MKRVSRLSERDLRRIVNRLIIEQDETNSISPDNRKDQVIRNSFIMGLEGILNKIKRNEPKYDSFSNNQKFKEQFSKYKNEIQNLLDETDNMF